MSEDKTNEFFSDGISGELLNLLSKIPQLKVAARTSSFSFKGKGVEIPEIARQLHVANVLEGSVRRSGDQLRITAQLIRAAEGYHLWSETYDRKMDDIFKIQDEIAGEVEGIESKVARRNAESTHDRSQGLRALSAGQGARAAVQSRSIREVRRALAASTRNRRRGTISPS
jgi:TolB-like protein